MLLKQFKRDKLPRNKPGYIWKSSSSQIAAIIQWTQGQYATQCSRLSPSFHRYQIILFGERDDLSEAFMQHYSGWETNWSHDSMIHVAKTNRYCNC